MNHLHSHSHSHSNNPFGFFGKKHEQLVEFGETLNFNFNYFNFSFITGEEDNEDDEYDDYCDYHDYHDERDQGTTEFGRWRGNEWENEWDRDRDREKETKDISSRKQKQLWARKNTERSHFQQYGNMMMLFEDKRVNKDVILRRKRPDSPRKTEREGGQGEGEGDLAEMQPKLPFPLATDATEATEATKPDLSASACARSFLASNISFVSSPAHTVSHEVSRSISHGTNHDADDDYDGRINAQNVQIAARPLPKLSIWKRIVLLSLVNGVVIGSVLWLVLYTFLSRDYHYLVIHSQSSVAGISPYFSTLVALCGAAISVLSTLLLMVSFSRMSNDIDDDDDDEATITNNDMDLRKQIFDIRNVGATAWKNTDNSEKTRNTTTSIDARATPQSDHLQEDSSSSSSSIAAIAPSPLLPTDVSVVKPAPRPKALQDQPMYATICGVMGGLGPKATAQFFDDGIVEGRIRLFNAIRSVNNLKEPFAGFTALAPQHLELLTTKINSVSSADWSKEEVLALWTQTRGRKQLLDQDHIPLLLYDNSAVPPRPSYILAGAGSQEVDPFPALLHTAESLLAAGASRLCMVCNTAHFFKKELEDALAERDKVDLSPEDSGGGSSIAPLFLDMRELTLAYVCRISDKPCGDLGNRTIRVGLLATSATLQTRIFESAASEMNQAQGHPARPNQHVSSYPLEVVTPPQIAELHRGDQHNIENAIFAEQGIKAGYVNVSSCATSRRNLAMLLIEVLKLYDAGVSAVVLGCTELPLVLSGKIIQEYGAIALAEYAPDFEPKLSMYINEIQLVNPTQVLADEVLKITLLSRTRL